MFMVIRRMIKEMYESVSSHISSNYRESNVLFRIKIVMTC